MRKLTFLILGLCMAGCGGGGPVDPSPLDLTQGDWLSTVMEIQYWIEPGVPSTTLRRRWWLSVDGGGCRGGLAGDGVTSPTTERNGPWPCSVTGQNDQVVIVLSIPRPDPEEDGDLIFSGTVFEASMAGFVTGIPSSNASVSEQELWFMPDS